MSQQILQSILDKLNATSADIRASVFMTKEGLALACASPHIQPAPGDEDRISALSASILHLGHKFMGDFGGGELDQVLIKGEAGHMLAVHDKEGLALTVLARPGAESNLIFPQMKLAVDSLRQTFRDPALNLRDSSLEHLLGHPA